MINLFSKTDDLIKDVEICSVKQMILWKMIKLLSKTGLGRSGHVRFPTFGRILFSKNKWFYKNDKFGNKKWKGVFSEKIKVFPLVSSKYLSSCTGLGRSGHVQSQSFGLISHVSGPKLSFWRNF